MPEVASLYRLDIPYHENEPLMQRVKELRSEWDPILTAQMDEILKRGK